MSLPPPSGARELRLALAAIVRDEAPYLLEWIAFHRVLGIERFFLADNGSTDGTTELLAALADLGLVRHLPFPGEPGRAPQLPAYAALLERHRDEADWIAFLDADEFLLPAEGTVAGVVAELARDPSVGAIAVNWAVYGSSHEAGPGPGLVVERFAHRARKAFFPNHHSKAILRPAAALGPGPNPHAFVLRAGYRTVHADGEAVGDWLLSRPGISPRVCWSPLRINHYVVKSRAEFFARKAARGRATTAASRGAAFFRAHDRNDCADPVAPALVAATRRERARLREALWGGLGRAPREAPCRTGVSPR